MRGWGGEELRKSREGESGLEGGLGVMRDMHKKAHQADELKSSTNQN